MKRGIAVAGAMTAGLIAACLSIPTYQGPVLLSYSESGSGASIASADFSLHFAGGSGFHFPDALLVDNVDVMGHASSPCWGQSGTGFAVMPMPPVSGDPETGGPAAMTSQLTAVLRGPAVVQVRLDWTTRFDFTSSPMCSPNPNHMPGGSSTFTVFPEGRIVRHDQLTDTNPNMERVTASQCTCPDPALVPELFHLSSYWAFARDMFPMQVGLRTPNDPTLFDDLGAIPTAIISNYNTICINNTASTSQIASTWVVPPGAGPVTFGYNALISHDVQKSPTQTLDFSWDVHGALFITHTDCTAAFSRAIEYTQQQAKLVINGTTYTTSGLDGMFGGDPGDGSHGIDVPDGRTTLSLPLITPDGPPAPFTSSFAVWLRFPRDIDVPVATRAGAVGVWYVPQRVDARNWIVWFRDPLLQSSETITIGPN